MKACRGGDGGTVISVIADTYIPESDILTFYLACMDVTIEKYIWWQVHLICTLYGQFRIRDEPRIGGEDQIYRILSHDGQLQLWIPHPFVICGSRVGNLLAWTSLAILGHMAAENKSLARLRVTGLGYLCSSPIGRRMVLTSTTSSSRMWCPAPDIHH